MKLSAEAPAANCGGRFGIKKRGGGARNTRALPPHPKISQSKKSTEKPCSLRFTLD